MNKQYKREMAEIGVLPDESHWNANCFTCFERPTKGSKEPESYIAFEWANNHNQQNPKHHVYMTLLHTWEFGYDQ